MAFDDFVRVACLTVFLLCGVKGRQNWTGFKLYSVWPQSESQATFVSDFLENNQGADEWSDVTEGLESKVVLPPGLLDRFEKEAKGQGLKFKQLNANVGSLIADGQMETVIGFSQGSGFGGSPRIDHENYHDYDQIVTYYKILAKKYPTNVELHECKEKTPEGRTMIWIRIHNNIPFKGKPVVMMEAGIHAREWISYAATLWAVENLLQKWADGDEVAHSMLQYHDYVVMPHANPDGYMYSRTTYRMWRKNRSNYTFNGTSCTGVDLNRNFDAKWNSTGVKKKCTSISFAGLSAFSEPESRNVKQVLDKYKAYIVSYLSIHSYSQYILTPWAFNKTVSPHHTEITRVADEMAKAINKTHGKEFQVGPSYKLLRYVPSGTSGDWSQLQLPGAYTYVYELRPLRRDKRGFNLPPEEIIPSGQEFYNSLVAHATKMDLKPFPNIDDLFKGHHAID